jgi:hypothetical protein
MSNPANHLCGCGEKTFDECLKDCVALFPPGEDVDLDIPFLDLEPLSSYDLDDDFLDMELVDVDY